MSMEDHVKYVCNIVINYTILALSHDQMWSDDHVTWSCDHIQYLDSLVIQSWEGPRHILHICENNAKFSIVLNAYESSRAEKYQRQR